MRQILEQEPAVGVGVVAHASLSFGCQIRPAPGPSAPRPRRTAPRTGNSAATLPAAHMPGFGRQLGERHLMRAPDAFGAPTIHLLGPVQPLGVRKTIIGQHGRRTAPADACAPAVWMCRISATTSSARWRPCAGASVPRVAGPSTKSGSISVTDEQSTPARHAADPGQHRGIGDLVAIQMQDGQHGPVAGRIKELIGVPARPAALSPPRRRPRRTPRSGPGCRRPRRMRETARSPAHPPSWMEPGVSGAT